MGDISEGSKVTRQAPVDGVDDMLSLFAASGETGRQMLTVDWAATPLGPVQGWPQSLRTAVSIVLASRHPLLIWWGPELVMLYNDALAPSLGGKHPASVGRPGQEMLAEMWDVIGPMLHGVLSDGKATWRYDEPLPMDRRGFLEDTYWTYSYSPILDESGAVAGVFTATSETTDRVLRERRLGILQELAHAGDGARSRETVCEATVRVLGRHPTDAAFAAVYLADEDGVLRLVTRTPDAPSDLPATQEANSPVWPLLRALADTRLTVVETAAGSAALVPVLPPGGIGAGGVLVVGLEPTVHFEVEYERFLEAVAGRLANALADVEAYMAQRMRAEALAELHRARSEALAKEHLIADELQRSLLPAELGKPEGLEVAVHYRAGVEGTQVGGDWYDVIDLGGGRTGLVIGDVMGRGVQAAAVMGQLRTAIRAYAMLDLSPGTVLELLDRLVLGMSGDHIATAVYAVYDASDGSLTYANAGHPPPLLHAEGQAEALRGDSSPPLGTGYRVAPTEERLVPPAGSLLALYTDGLVEQRGQDLEEGISALRGQLDSAACREGPFIAEPARMVDRLRPGGVAEDDDIALLLVRMNASAHAEVEERATVLPAEHLSVRTARRFVQELVTDAGRLEWEEAAVLAVSEVVTNAVLHGHTSVHLSARAYPDRLYVAVRDLNPSLPLHRPQDEDATTGRGIALVEAVTSSSGVEELGAEGKVVWFTVGAPEPADAVTRRAPAAAAASSHQTVVLRSLPATLWLAARQHHDTLLRELALTQPRGSARRLSDADAARRRISEALDRALVVAKGRGETRAPLPSGHPGRLPEVPAVLHLAIDVPAEAGHQYAALQDALDQAERLAASGRTLARPGLPEIVAVRDWACEQVIAQLAGAPPSPWTGLDTEHFTAEPPGQDLTFPEWNTEVLLNEGRWGVVADDANRILGISPALAELFGWDAEDLVGRRVVALVPPRFREAHVAGFTRHLTTGEAHAIGVELQLPVLRADGTELVCTFLIEARSTGGRTVYVAWITP